MPENPLTGLRRQRLADGCRGEEGGGRDQDDGTGPAHFRIFAFEGKRPVTGIVGERVGTGGSGRAGSAIPSARSAHNFVANAKKVMTATIRRCNLQTLNKKVAGAAHAAQVEGGKNRSKRGA